MGGTGALNIALSGLTAAQASLNVISNNISNVNTPGYTRKELPQSTTILGGIGAGVRTDKIIRSVDLALQRDLFEQTSITANLQTKQTYFDQIQTFHSDPSLERDVASQLAKLSDSFISLENSPEDIFALEDTLDAAQSYASSLNGLSSFITRLRNDVQVAITESVNRINSYLEQIADLNVEIISSSAQSFSLAALQDDRDRLVQSLSEELGVKFFTTAEGEISIRTSESNVQLVDVRSEGLFFNPTPVSPQNFYPDSASPVLVGNNGDPNTATDITADDLGGRLGALLELRDDILPQYTAQVDELAIRTAERFQAQGLELFTDASGQIPDPTPADITTDPVTPAAYVGFASTIRVNEAVLADPTLIRTGTVSGLTVADGSNEIIRRINEFAFGTTQENNVNGVIPVGTIAGVDFGFDTIFAARGTADLVVDPLAPITLDSLANINPGLNDSFQISTDNGVTFNTFTIGAGDTAQDLVNQINATYPGLARINTDGEIIFGNNSGLIFQDVNLGVAGLQDLGFDTFTGVGPLPPVNLNDSLPATTIFSGLGTVDIVALGSLDSSPSINPVAGAVGNDTFEISVNGTSFAQFEIEAGDTAQDLVDKINAVFPELATLTSGGQLLLRNETGLTVQDVNLGAAGQAALGLDTLIAGGAVTGYQQNTQVGITTIYNAQGSVNVEALTSLDELVAIEPGFDTFQISVDGGGFTSFQIQPGETASQLATRINGIYPGLVEINALGQFEFENNVGFEIQNVNLSQAGLEALGIDQFTDTGPIAPTHPSFTLQFGNDTPVTIDILPTDTPTDIANRINTLVPDVSASYDTLTGEFLIDPDNGGDITFVDGFQQPIEALGLTFSLVGHNSFQNSNLGPNASVGSGIISTNVSLLDFAQSLINVQSNASNINQQTADTEEAFRSTLESTLLDQSGVNVDEELARLIVVQTAYAASARVVSTIEEFFDTLLAAF